MVGNPLICGKNSRNNCSVVYLEPLSFPPEAVKGKYHLIFFHRLCLLIEMMYCLISVSYAGQSDSGTKQHVAMAFGTSFGGAFLIIVVFMILAVDNVVGGQIEVELTSLAVHRNLLPLWGFCSTESERLLIYPYMPNGSVATRLKGKRNPTINHHLIIMFFRRPCPWEAGTGLVKAKEDSTGHCTGPGVSCDPRVIRCDVKAANILLDEDFEAVWLAKLLDHRDLMSPQRAKTSRQANHPRRLMSSGLESYSWS
ncbi:hypothetical protein SASPL_154611 [Salvia splendens]|uniref:Uncharacterized protein n=1 Tax=Salvia splendens TaxID=180675 RepID=A0A8X8W0E9_SALSN|nr:hypothetical protein SASPL_154611 [Salvia splendens]